MGNACTTINNELLKKRTIGLIFEMRRIKFLTRDFFTR